MELLLGPHRFDVTHRAVVLGVVDGEGTALDHLLRAADALVSLGADALEVGGPGAVPAVAALRARFEVPLSVRTDAAEAAAAAFAEGAVVGHDRSGFADPGYLPACVAAGASVVAGSVQADIDQLAECAARAQAAGIAAPRVLVDPAPRSAADLHAIGSVVALGHPVLVAVPFGPDAAIAANALAVALGARVLRTRDVKAARRVADTMAAILQAAA